MKKIQAIIFDADGTLFSTEKMSADTLRSMLVERSIAFDESIFDILVGKAYPYWTNFMRDHLKIQQADEFMEELMDNLGKRILRLGLPVKKGVRNLINYAKEIGMPIALATNSQRKSAEFYFSNTELSLDEFDHVFTLESVSNPKPDREMYEKACLALGFAPENCMAIEDSEVGMNSAIEAGCTTVLIPDCAPPTDDLLQRVDYVVHDCDEVIELLKSI